MASGFSKEVFNTREEVVSNDLMRGQALASRDLQNMEGSRSRSLDASSFPPSGTNLFDANGAPIGSVNQAPTLASPSGFNMTLGGGDGFLSSSSGVTADDSNYQVLRWATQTVTFTTPHATLPRIDVVYATLGSLATDGAVRNILVDPAARTVAAQSVNKTVNPRSTIGVQAGTAASTPLVPSIPADSLALYYVYVPAAAGSAANFGKCRAAWRRANYPFTGMSGVLSGMGIKWDLTSDPASTSAIVAIRGFHHVIIDGEVMEFWCNFDSTSATAMFVADSTANPFGSAAPATAHRPYYFYAVGGRNSPAPSRNSFDGVVAPVTIVESTVAPDLGTNKASGNMTVNGVTVTPAATCYMGLGFVFKNTTHRLGCIMDEAMTIFGPSSDATATLTKVGSGTELIGAPANRPGISTRARVAVLATTGDAAVKNFEIISDGGGGAVAPSWDGVADNGFYSGTFASGTYGGSAVPRQAVIRWQAGANANMWVNGGIAGDTFQLRYFGYDHRVGRLGMHVNT